MKFCKACGNQIDDNSNFCNICGCAVEVQAQYQYQPPQPQIQYFETPVPEGYNEYIARAGKLMSKSITALVLTFVIPVYGLIIGFFMSLSVKSGLRKLPDIDKADLISPKSIDNYASAHRKATTAKKLSSVSFTISSIILSLFAVAGIILLFVMVIIPNLS